MLLFLVVSFQKLALKRRRIQILASQDISQIYSILLSLSIIYLVVVVVVDLRSQNVNHIV